MISSGSQLCIHTSSKPESKFRISFLSSRTGHSFALVAHHSLFNFLYIYKCLLHINACSGGITNGMHDVLLFRWKHKCFYGYRPEAASSWYLPRPIERECSCYNWSRYAAHVWMNTDVYHMSYILIIAWFWGNEKKDYTCCKVSRHDALHTCSTGIRYSVDFSSARVLEMLRAYTPRDTTCSNCYPRRSGEKGSTRDATQVLWSIIHEWSKSKALVIGYSVEKST